MGRQITFFSFLLLTLITVSFAQQSKKDTLLFKLETDKNLSGIDSLLLENFIDSVFTANSGFDYKILRKIPDSSIDYKILRYLPDPSVDYKILRVIPGNKDSHKPMNFKIIPQSDKNYNWENFENNLNKNFKWKRDSLKNFFDKKLK